MSDSESLESMKVTYKNMHRCPESDVEFICNGRRKRALMVVDSSRYYRRQMYLRSYTFTREEKKGCGKSLVKAKKNLVGAVRAGKKLFSRVFFKCVSITIADKSSVWMLLQMTSRLDLASFFSFFFIFD